MAQISELLKSLQQGNGGSTQDPFMSGTPWGLDADRPRPMNLDGSLNQGLADAADEGMMRRQDMAVDRHIAGQGFTKPQSPFQLDAPAPPTVGPTLANAAALPKASDGITFPGLQGQGQAGLAEFNASAPSPLGSTSGSGIGTSVVNDVNFLQEGLRQAQGMEPSPQAPAPEPSFDGLTTAGGQPLAEFLEGGQQLDPQGRMIDPNVDRSSFERESAAREARMDQRQDFGTAVSDRDRRAARGEGMSMADATQLTGGDRDAARALLKRQELGLGEFEVSAPSPADALAREKWEASQAGAAEPTTADKRLAFDKEKYSALIAKEAAGTPLTPSEELARDRFEYEKEQDTAKAAAGPAKTSTERNIDRLMEANPNMSRSEAINIEQGAISKTVNPLTGATEMTNIATGESTPVKSTEPLPDASLNLEPAESGTSLFDRGQKYTGAIEAGLRAGQKVAGQFGGKIVSDESTQTKKELDAFQGSLVRAFQEGDRFSTGQDKVLREELDATLGAMKDPETFKNNAIALDKVMRQRHADLIENYKDTTMDSDFRADSRSKSRVLERAIRDLGVTQEADVGEATESATIPEGVNKAFSQEMWDVLTPEERATLQGGK